MPSDFRSFLAEVGGFRFDWGNGEDETPFEFLEYGGNSEVGFVRAAEGLDLVQLYEELQDSYASYGVEDQEQVKAVAKCFPLYLLDGVGNALVLKLDCDPCEVHLLKSEFCWHLDEALLVHQGSLICSGFERFLQGWVALAAPATESMNAALEACGGDIGDLPPGLVEGLDAWLRAADRP